jgi:hypothetical protein
MEKVELSLNVVNTLLAYLQDKPFKESAPLIEALVADIKKNNPQDIQAPDTTQSEETK